MPRSVFGAPTDDLQAQPLGELSVRPRIAIIGGMGPQASYGLHKRLVDGSREFHEGGNDDYPAIVHFSIPVPDFIGNQQQKAAAIKMLRS